jgi:hypothetical protein
MDFTNFQISYPTITPLRPLLFFLLFNISLYLIYIQFFSLNPSLCSDWSILSHFCNIFIFNTMLEDILWQFQFTSLNSDFRKERDFMSFIIQKIDAKFIVTKMWTHQNAYLILSGITFMRYSHRQRQVGGFLQVSSAKKTDRHDITLTLTP